MLTSQKETMITLITFIYCWSMVKRASGAGTVVRRMIFSQIKPTTLKLVSEAFPFNF